jgi:hypothetical protein
VVFDEPKEWVDDVDKSASLVGITARVAQARTLGITGVASMRYIVFCFLGVFAQVVFSQVSYDQTLARDAGRAYVESYMRLHPTDHIPIFAWDKSTLEYVTWSGGDTTGFVGMFVPDTASGGCGVAVFSVRGGPGHLIAGAWGYAPSLKDAKRQFEDSASRGITEFL